MAQGCFFDRALECHPLSYSEARTSFCLFGPRNIVFKLQREVLDVARLETASGQRSCDPDSQMGFLESEKVGTEGRGPRETFTAHSQVLEGVGSTRLEFEAERV